MTHLAHLSVESRRRAKREREQQAQSQPALKRAPGERTSQRDVVEFAYRIGQPHMLGLPATHAELDALLALEGTADVAGVDGTPVASAPGSVPAAHGLGDHSPDITLQETPYSPPDMPSRPENPHVAHERWRAQHVARLEEDGWTVYQPDNTYSAPSRLVSSPEQLPEGEL